jgi:Spermine/spermidine synthase domain
MSHYYSLFAATIFLSSFLLFQVQPLIGKHILPWYGGSSAVWVTALLFFMVALAVGYVYALIIARLTPRFQVGLHGVFVAAVAAQVFFHTRSWPSGITPTQQDLALFTADPTLSVFVTLFVSLGLPFILLSSTSSLIQLWYARVSGQDPSSLYSISNIGSLVGLLSYPFIIEPLLGTYAQGNWWTVGLALYIGFLCSVMLVFLRESKALNILVTTKSETAPVSGKDFVTWLLVASVPVMVLLSGTTFMTEIVAPIPLLWVGPLALYLGSFIWSFRSRSTPSYPALHQVAVVALSLITLVVTTGRGVSAIVTILVTHATIMAIFHWCHEYLYAKRPEAAQLPLFYVALSLGGILGSVVVKISSLYILTLPIELLVILTLSVLGIIYRWSKELPDFIRLTTPLHSYVLLGSMAVMVIGISGFQIYFREANVSAQSRNFFGYKSIIEYVKDGHTLRMIGHGRTNHGSQLVDEGVPRIQPISYYSPDSGIGKSISYLRETQADPLRVAIIGLGTGGLAAYCRPEDDFTFIEIDPQVVALARSHFTYLAACQQVKVTIADGRLALAAEKEERSAKYDLIVLDAYADDVIPMHLMTTEAIALYKDLLTDTGVLAVHISSLYLDLRPVTVAVAEDNGLHLRYFFNKHPEESYNNPAQWVILAKDEAVFDHGAFADMVPVLDEDPVLWTDTYSALLPIVRLW